MCAPPVRTARTCQKTHLGFGSWAAAKRKKEKRDELESMPSAKMRMKTSDFEKASSHKEKKSSEIVLNVVLAILILALVAIIGYLVWTFKNI